MLTCRDIATQASDYLERKLTLRQRLAVGLHLLLCGRCRDFLRHLRVSLAYYRGLSPKALDDAEASALVKRITGE